MARSDVDVAVIGAGAAGVACAALVQRRGHSATILECAPQVGESWRRRYDGLGLNTVRWMSDLPGYRMGRGRSRWPEAIEWAAYLERYATHHDLDVRFGAAARHITRSAEGWRVETSAGAISSRAVIVATGHDHTAFIPDWPGRDGFAGELLHSADYREAESFAGRDVLVIGSGNSAFEIATFLAAGGAGRVRVAVRTSPLILQREYLGVPATPLGLLASWLPDALLDRLGRAARYLKFGDLTPYGLPPSPQRLSDMKRRYFAPPMDSGFVDRLKAGEIEIVAAVESFERADVVLGDGVRITPEVVIAATGYRTNLAPLVGHLHVLTDDEEPRSRGGKPLPNAPGLFFAGFRYGLLALLPYIELDARAIARQIDRLLRERSGENRHFNPR